MINRDIEVIALAKVLRLSKLGYLVKPKRLKCYPAITYDKIPNDDYIMAACLEF